jgi:hypothetical protein
VAEEQRTGRLTAVEEHQTRQLTAAAALGLGGGPARARARVLGEGGGALNRSRGVPRRAGSQPHSCARLARGWVLPRSISDPRSGMTGGARPSAAEAGGRGAGSRWADWAASGLTASGSGGGGGGVAVLWARG